MEQELGAVWDDQQQQWWDEAEVGDDDENQQCFSRWLVMKMSAKEKAGYGNR